MMIPDLGLTFAGGGNRAFYQMGFLERWGGELFPRTRAVAACSAGAAVVITWLAERRETAHAFWLERVVGITRNFAWERLLRGERPAPQGAIYHETLLHTLAEGGLERVRAQPFPILILASGLPRRLPPTLAVALGIGLYQLEKALRPRMIHPAWPQRLGFTPAVYDARACETPEALAALVLASSATPPFTPVGRVGDRRLLDGGMIDNVPAFVTEAVPGVRRNLVLLTRPYPAGVLGARGGRLYVAPSRPTPINRWDYTRPSLLADTIAMGRAEADAVHRPALEAFLAADAPEAPR